MIKSRDNKKRAIFIITYHPLAEGDTMGSTERVSSLISYLSKTYNVVYIRTGWAAKIIVNLSEDVSASYLICRKKKNGFFLRIYHRAARMMRCVKCTPNFSELELIERQQGGFAVFIKLLGLALRYQPVAVLPMYIWSIKPIRWVAKILGIPIILDTHDVMSIRYKAASKIGEKSFQVGKEEELTRWGWADILIAIQDKEAKQMHIMNPEAHVIVVPHSHGSPIPLQRSRFSAVLLFVGSSSRHNISALEAFLTGPWNEILESFPEAKLHVCGDVCNSFNDEFKNVLFFGKVNDLVEAYRSADIVLNIPVFGSGLKIKAIEAMRYGKCMICTPVGAQGLENFAGRGFVLSDLEQLSSICIDLLQNPSKINFFERSAVEIYCESFVPESCYKNLTDMLTN